MPDTPRQYEPGDCVIRQLGLIRLEGGEEIMGILLTCPAGPPDYPASMAWDGTPFILAPRETANK